MLFVVFNVIQPALHQCRRIIQFCTFHYFFLAGQRIHQALLCGIQPLPYLLGLIPVLLISGVLYGFTRFTNHIGTVQCLTTNPEHTNHCPKTQSTHPI